MTRPDLDRTISAEDFDDFLEQMAIFAGPDAGRLLRLIGVPKLKIRDFSRSRRHDDWSATFGELDEGVTGTETPYRDLLHAALRMRPGNTVFNRVKAADDGPPPPPNGTRRAVWRVAVVRASPEGRERLRGELKVIRTAAVAGHLVIDDRPDAELLDLAALLEFKPDILHISGHGEDANLVFADADGDPDPVAAEHVAELLTGYRTQGNLKLSGIVLNSCESADVAELFRPVADVIVAHRGTVENGCVVEFTGQLYSLLRTVGELGAAAKVAALHVKRACPALHDGLLVLPP